jgi:hypothetical protein
MEYEEPELVRTLKTLDRELATFRSDLLGYMRLYWARESLNDWRIICTFL